MTPVPLQITFDGLAPSDPIEADIRERAAWLEQYYPRITGCRVLVKVPHRHQRTGRHFHVVIDVSVPGGAPIVVSHHPSLHDVEATAARKEAVIDPVLRHARAAIHQAFDAARRRLQDFAREQRGDTAPAVTGTELA